MIYRTIRYKTLDENRVREIRHIEFPHNLIQPGETVVAVYPVRALPVGDIRYDGMYYELEVLLSQQAGAAE